MFTPTSVEWRVKERLAKKVSSIYLGLWLLIPEHLRLGSWDLLKSWSGGSDEDIEPRLALQMVHESALCVSGVRPTRSLSHQDFDLLNGLPDVATDNGLVMADTEHATVKILDAFYEDEQFDILMPMSLTQKIKKIMQSLTYQRRWAGYTLAETTYKMQGS